MTPRGPTRLWGSRAAATLAGLAVAALLAEVGLRLVPIRSETLLPLPYGHLEVQRIASGGLYFRVDSMLGWALTPAVVRGVGGIYRTNGAGLRAEREYSLEPPPGVRRLAAFGDSFTHCDEVDYPDCWTSRLAEAWPGTEILNFGVGGYGPDQAWLRYQRDGRPYRPCAVLIGYMVENLNRVVNRFRPFYAPGSGLVFGKPRFLLDGDGLALLSNPATTPDLLGDPRWVEEALGPHDYWYFPGMFVANPLDISQVVRVARTAAYRRHLAERGATDPRTRELAGAYRGEQEAYRVAGRVLIHFAQQVREDGATPVVVVFGREEEIVALSRGEGKVHAPLLDWLARERIPTVDVTDALAGEASRADVDALVNRAGRHYTEAGNLVVAATLATRLPDLIGATCRDGGPTRSDQDGSRRG